MMTAPECRQLRHSGVWLALFVLTTVATLAGPSWAATPLRVHATESNREPVATSLSEKERLVNLILERWQATAIRAGNDPIAWRDTFGLQLSLLPASKLQELVAANPATGYQGVVEAVVQSQLAGMDKGGSPTKSLGQTTTDLVFVAINPCRIVDTRNAGGAISAASPRSFIFSTTPAGNFSAQGGSATNCNLGFTGNIVPLAPKAIAATVTIVTPTADGNMVIYPAGTTPGATSALNYNAGAVLANTTVIVGAQSGATDFTVALNGPAQSAHVVIDAIGYYYAPAATALDCVWTAVSTVDIPSGTASSTSSPACAAGYALVSGACYMPTADAALIENGEGTFFNFPGWYCYGRAGATASSISAFGRCCRVPGH
jgi:hypothetical protein